MNLSLIFPKRASNVQVTVAPRLYAQCSQLFIFEVVKLSFHIVRAFTPHHFAAFKDPNAPWQTSRFVSVRCRADLRTGWPSVEKHWTVDLLHISTEFSKVVTNVLLAPVCLLGKSYRDLAIPLSCNETITFTLLGIPFSLTPSTNNLHTTVRCAIRYGWIRTSIAHDTRNSARDKAVLFVRFGPTNCAIPALSSRFV